MKKLLSLLLALLMLVSVLPLSIFADTDETQVPIDDSLPQIVYELPPIPEGYSYSGRHFTDEFGNTVYYICQSGGEQGLVFGYWIDQNGDPLPDDTAAWLSGITEKKSASAGKLLKAPSSLPESYDARDEGLVSPVKAQIGGTCWAFASMAALESNALKQGLADKENKPDLNEYHLIWNVYDGYYNGVTDSRNDGSIEFTDDPSEMLSEGGGTYWAGIGLLNFAGAVSEEVLSIESYNETDVVNESESKFSFDNKYTRNITCDEIINIPLNRDDMKQAILDYGGLYLSYQTKGTDGYTHSKEKNISAYFRSNDIEEIRSLKLGGHAVELIGWDDNFAKENFEYRQPESDGAWLCKNSWGIWGCQGGFFWISYEEASIREATAFKAVSTEDTSVVFMHDGFGRSSSIAVSKAANVFTADKATTLTRFSVGDISSESCKLEIYLLADGFSDPTDGTLIYSQSGDLSGKMYTELNNPVRIKAGDTFSVVISNMSSYNVEGFNTETSRYTSNERESFYFKNGVWYDSAYQRYQDGDRAFNNFCIRIVGREAVDTDPCRVDFVCGSNVIVEYEVNGTVKLPQTEGYTWVLRYNGVEFDGTAVRSDMTVEAHCYPTEGKISESSPCVTEYRCIYCSKEMKAALSNHEYEDGFCIVCGQKQPTPGSDSPFDAVIRFFASFWDNFLAFFRALFVI